MSKIFNVFLLNLIVLSGMYQYDALLLDVPTLEKVNFEIEDSELKEIENFPKPLRSYSEDRKTKAGGKRNYYYEGTDEPLDEFIRKDNDGGNIGDGIDAVQDLEGSFLARPQRKDMIDWKYGPLFREERMNKRALAENARMRRNPGECRSAFAPEKPIRYLDYTNSQMPFNEGKLQKKNQANTSQGSDKSSLCNEKKNFVGEGCSKGKSKRSMKRRRFFEVPFRSRNFEIPRDGPLLKYSRVRRFLDHKRAKKQISMTSTLEAKEAAMSRVLDPNLNLDGILEPHVRKRRGRFIGLHARNFIFKQSHVKRRQPTVKENPFEF